MRDDDRIYSEMRTEDVIVDRRTKDRESQRNQS